MFIDEFSRKWRNQSSFIPAKYLRRMASNVQKKIEFIDTTMYHHGLVKILIGLHLKGTGDT